MRYLLFLTLFLITSCSNSHEKKKAESDLQNEYNTNNVDEEIEKTNESEGNVAEDDGGFKDGTYEAEVEYYNPNTGRTSYYTLDVEVVDNIVTVIHFSNGGWLDETHIISGGELDENGTTTIESDKGYYYTVNINR